MACLSCFTPVLEQVYQDGGISSIYSLGITVDGIPSVVLVEESREAILMARHQVGIVQAQVDGLQ
jgi:hypothetical protein